MPQITSINTNHHKKLVVYRCLLQAKNKLTNYVKTKVNRRLNQLKFSKSFNLLSIKILES